RESARADVESGVAETHRELTTGGGPRAMSHPPDSPYDTRLDILYEPLELVEVQAVADSAAHPWFNQTLCKVNDSVVRVGIVKGEYHWHAHAGDDEFFYVVEGELLIDLEDRTVALEPRQGFVVPRGVRHRTRAPNRTIILMVENAGIIPTGDVESPPPHRP